MKILILEDMETRNIWFRQNLIGHVVHFADTVGKFIDLLELNTYDTIFLDHDLSDEHYMAFTKPSSTHLVGTGVDAAKWIAETGYTKSVQIIIHSLNPSGSQRMDNILKDAGYNVEQVNFLQLQTRMTLV